MRFAVPLEIDSACFVDWRQDAEPVEMGGETMGTTWRVLVSAAPGFDSAAMEAAISARLERILAEMSHWRADSVLGRFNRAPAGQWSVLPRDFAHVMTAALDTFERSRGAFDPAIGGLVNLWGFGPETVEGPPDPSQLDRARAASGAARLAFDATRRCLRQPGGLVLDLSGIAKGFAVDALAALLRTQGCNHGLVEIGGEFVGLGLRPDGDPWWVELETPTAGIAPLRVALHQLAVATSGDYVRGRHTIDPRTGVPVEHAMAVSVVHSSAMLADAWATALSVERPENMQSMAIGEGLAVRALTRSRENVTEWISPALAALIG